MTVGALLAAAARMMPRLEPLGAAPYGTGLDAPCTGVTHDSRRVTPGAVFVALRGFHADGAAFAPQAVASGAAAVVAEQPPAGGVAVPWVVVPDARLALAALACEFHGHPSRDLRVVGITGTNGKTTTSHLVRAILEAAGQPCGALGTVGYLIGGRDLPASRTTPEAPDLQALLRQMVDAGSRACAMEVSSHALALHRVEGMRFAAAVFTNLTRDHLDFHESMEEYFAAKRRLFEMLPPDAPAVINLDDPRGPLLTPIVRRPVTYALGRPADVTPGPVSFTFRGLVFDVHTPTGDVHVASKLAGRPNVYNILAAVAVATALDVRADAIETGLRELEGVPGRFQIVTAPADDISVVVDYAHTDDALRNLLETARAMGPRRIITVFGAGGDRDRTKRPLMGMVAARLSDIVIVTSDNPRGEDPMRIIEEVRRGAEAEMRLSRAEVLTVVDRRAAIREAIGRATPGDVVLIAGKGHETYQEIGGRILPFDDVAVAREALEPRRPARRG
jgi:UDP-N-acetylmuramoyl-L-alanyl-D-glutamate--2,6-diaminopimelate ligase